MQKFIYLCKSNFKKLISYAKSLFFCIYSKDPKKLRRNLNLVIFVEKLIDLIKFSVEYSLSSLPWRYKVVIT